MNENNERKIKAVFFDVGETLVDETSLWSEWADWLGVPRFTFMATFGGLIERGEANAHQKVFEVLRPDINLEKELLARKKSDNQEEHTAADFYDDALPCLAELKSLGYVIGISGNQPVRIEAFLKAHGVAADIVASSASWGLRKPDPKFFKKVIELSGFQASEIAYVGDRLDNDILPAGRAGMVSIFLIRGPWAYLSKDSTDTQRADITINSLQELTGVLATR